MGKVKEIADKAKKAVNNLKSTVKKIRKAIKFFMTPIGYFVGIMLLVILLIIIIVVLAKTIKHAIGEWLDDDYAGIATTEDYATIMGTVTYAGYDSFITEQKWQEYAAFEYAVLMDVADHMYEYQDYVTTKTGSDGKTYQTSAVFPEGETESEYNAYRISKGEWQKYVAQGNADNPPEELSNTTNVKSFGGNRNVVTPRLVYEIADHDYEDEAISLMPYVVIVREDMELNYYLTNEGDGIRPVRVSAKLNRYNTNTPMSAYKDLYEEQHDGKKVLGIEDPEGFVATDEDETGYGSEVYYTSTERDIVYKIPLKTLVNRYLPKSTLLTTWYMLKRSTGSNAGLDLEKMMEEIKGIYNAACYGGVEGTIGSKEAITVSGKKDEETGEISPVSGITLRTEKEEKKSAVIKDSVQFDEYEAILRDESGDAILADKEINIATTNNRTFIYFEQFGLETSRYEKFKDYAGGGINEPKAKAPVATYLTEDRVNFVQTINMHMIAYIEVTHTDDEGNTYTKEVPKDVNVKLKPTYSHMDEPGVGLDEKLKILYLSKTLYGDLMATNGEDIKQEKPYPFMRDVVELAEKNINNQRIVDYESYMDEVEDEATLYDHNVINEYYLIAEDGYAGTNKDTEKRYRLPEDFRYYNQDIIDEEPELKMPSWYDMKGNKNVSGAAVQTDVENSYLQAYKEVCTGGNWYDEVLAMIRKEAEPRAVRYDTDPSTIYYTKGYTSAPLYDSDRNEHTDMNDALKGPYKINYYWKPAYVIKEKELQTEATVHHTRMPALFVKYCDMWAKSVEYENKIIQNPIKYDEYKHLIPFSKTSLGLQSVDLYENASYRVQSFVEYFNKTNVSGKEGIKEADVLDMLIQWEEQAKKGGNEVSYSYMRDLYKLVINIRDFGGTMLESAYNYLYIPSTISNYSDATVQKIFWLERLAASKGEDELTLKEQERTKTRATEIEWQNLEYDEYYECVYDIGDTERAKVYALFPFGAPVIRSYYMLTKSEDIITNGYEKGKHEAVDMYSRAWARDILNRGTDEAKLIYYYELNRLTHSYMQNGNTKEDAFILAEKTLNSQLEYYTLYSPVVAIAPGRVVQVDYNSRSGFYVKIRHDNAYQTQETTSLYVHLKRWPLVDVGDYVGAGTILGYEGTTGRSTGNHLHFEMFIGRQKVDPLEYILPVYMPFYYDKKAVKVLEEDPSRALGSEYYTLERTILPEASLYNSYNLINGMTLQDGTKINYNITTNDVGPYKSGDSYTLSPYENIIWGNNVPTKELTDNLENMIDLSLLHQTEAFEHKDGDNPSGEKLIWDKKLGDVTATPAYFYNDERDLNKKVKDSNFDNEFDDNGRHKRLTWPKWFAEEMADNKSDLVVHYYNGPRKMGEEVSSEEALEDLKRMQNSLKDAGYYNMAGIKFETSGYGTYSEKFVKVVRAMQHDLIEMGYGIYDIKINGELDVNTVAAYNTMVQYTTSENQFAMEQKTSYNTGINYSIEPALIWSVIAAEGDGKEDRNIDKMALRESGDETGGVHFEYNSYSKVAKRDQGLMQLKPGIASGRYSSPSGKIEETLLEIKQPTINTKIGLEIIKEYMKDIYNEYGEAIEKAKNDIVFSRRKTGYWCTHVFNPGFYYEYRWCDPENIDRVIIYALALEAYNQNQMLSPQQVENVLQNGPSDYLKDVLGVLTHHIIKVKGESTGDVKEEMNEELLQEHLENPNADVEFKEPIGEAPDPLSPREAAALVQELGEQIGKPYLWGASGPDNFDCTGLVIYVYEKVLGVTVGYHTGTYQFSNCCISIPYEDAQVGDVFYYSSDGTPGGIYHAAIYVGNGKMIEAHSTDRGVIESPVTTPDFVGRIRR